MTPNNYHHCIIWLDSTESTNSALREKMAELDNMSVIASRFQTAGRGQGDHTWYSSPDKNLIFSILYRFSQLPASKAIRITQITTLAIVDYLSSKNIDARIKWPNDIWVGYKKICGILIENTVSNSFIQASIVGIGLNLNESSWPSNLPNPVSLSELTSRQYNLEDELPLLVSYMQNRFAQLCDEAILISDFEKLVFRL